VRPVAADFSPSLARRALVLLTLVNVLNYVDRYVLAALGESLARSRLHISDTEFGLLVSGFIVVYMVAAPWFGAMGDRGSRIDLVALGVFLWSAATGLGALAWGFASLLVARALVGVGEAAYGTVAPSLLADSFRPAVRGRVFAIFYAAIPIGSALGYIVGGLVDVHWGWRAAFLVAAGPGLALGVAIRHLVDPPRGASEDALTRPAPGAWRAWRALARNRPYGLTVLGYAAYTFALGGMAAFLPKFLIRVRGLPEGSATLWSGACLAATGFLGTAVGGAVGDWLLRWTRQAHLWVSGVATLIAAPVGWIALVSPRPATYWSAIVAAEFLLFISTGPVNSAILTFAAPEMRATAMAISIFVIHILGDVPSPIVLGALSDASSLARAVRIIPVAVAIGGLIWTWAAWRLNPSPPALRG
jgi:MFS transporter, Spinster family, sphingosine-1-phosphate transporter